MKQKNFELVPYILLSVVGVILAGIIICFILANVNSTTDAAGRILDKTEKIAADMEEYSITKYDGEEIRGSEVRNFMKEHLGDYSAAEAAPIYVRVTTVVSGSTYTNTYVNKQYLGDIKNIARMEYFIKPTAYFTGEVVRSANKAILGVSFIQK